MKTRMAAWVVGLALLGAGVVGCGDDGGESDLSATGDLSASPDLAQPVDMAHPVDLMQPCEPDGGTPETLACAGIYSDWNTKTLAADVHPYAPGYTLWADGAVKSRYVKLPAGTKIDVSNPSDWVFPIGTKFYKEFKLTISAVEKRIETRMYWKRGDADWVPVVYRWTADESNAPRLTTGETNVGGTTFEVPAENRCVACHHGHTDAPVGFEAVLLADAAATGLAYTQLQAQSLLSSTVVGNDTIPASALVIPGNATEKAAIGYLHANCGIMCHRPGGGAPFFLDVHIASGVTPGSVFSTRAFGAINVASTHVLAAPPIADAIYYRIRPTDVDRSMIHDRMNIRDEASGGVDQMPPLLTHTKDTAGLATVDAWITSMTVAAGYPVAAPPGP